MRTDANFLNFCIATVHRGRCVLGLVLLMAGMYGKVGTEDEARRSQQARLVL